MRILINIVIMIFMATLPPTGMGTTRESPDSEASQQPLFSFGIIADVQYCDCEPFNTRYYRNSTEKLSEAMSAFSDFSPAFILNLGDLIDRDYGSFATVLDIMNQGTARIYHCLGNHDFSVTARDARKVNQITGSKTGYYSFTTEGFRFIVLNGTEAATYSARAADRKLGEKMLSNLEADSAPNAQIWNGGLGPDQLEWLVKELNQSVSANEKVFMVCHFPVFPVSAFNLFNSEEILDIMGRYDNIIAWFNGHNHDGNYGNRNMVHFVTFRGMVETPSTNSFAIVEVYSNKLWIKGSGREKSQILAY